MSFDESHPVSKYSVQYCKEKENSKANKKGF
jgi:hypothetical protein